MMCASKGILKKINEISWTLKFQYSVVCIKYLISLCLTKFFFKKQRQQNIWLISEREDEARDNAYHLFSYVRKNHPEVPIYYVIKKNAPDREKIKMLGNIIAFGSFKHYIYYMCSKLCLSTHIYQYVPNKKVFSYLDKLFGIEKKRVFLQHGIIMNFHPSDMYEDNCIDLYICGGKLEHKYIMHAYGYPKTVAKYTGLARYDNLLEFKTKRQILVMPTWRSYLSLLTEEDFKKTKYYKEYSNLISNFKLLNYTSENGYKIIFYPHYEMQKFVHLFTVKKSNVILAMHDDYDVQTLLKESDLLITDYSSIHFDFAYMKKPILYFQFDSDEFYSSHYQRGYYSFEKHGFGDVVTNLSTLIEKIINKVKTHNILDDIYEKRTDDFFNYRDANNCLRNYKAIIECLNNTNNKR